ncbi:uncharacterized [Tachysurus ichikawai]
MYGSGAEDKSPVSVSVKVVKYILYAQRTEVQKAPDSTLPITSPVVPPTGDQHGKEVGHCRVDCVLVRSKAISAEQQSSQPNPP